MTKATSCASTMLTSILPNVNLDRYLAAYEKVVRLFDGYQLI